MISRAALLALEKCRDFSIPLNYVMIAKTVNGTNKGSEFYEKDFGSISEVYDSPDCV